MSLYRPRARAIVTFPVDSGSDTETFEIGVKSVRIERNDHNHADTCEITTDWKEAGLDPRLLSNGTVVLYLGNADTEAYWEPKDSDIQFVGIMRKPRRHGSAETLSVTLLFHDYTTLFLEAKQFPASGIPDLSMTLSQAWGLICDHTGSVNPATGEIEPSVKVLRNRLVFKGGVQDVTLSKAVAKRFQKLGKVQVKPGSDAWAVWQHCVGMLGLISYIDKDTCVITTSSDYYAGNNPPRLIWGHNVSSIDEDRDLRTAIGGVGITSFDPLTGTTLEAVWPPIGDPSIRKPTLGAKKTKGPPNLAAGEKRDYFSYPGVTDGSTLLEIARRVYEERSRQDLEGTITTEEMVIERLNGDTADILALKPGEVIRLEINRDDFEYMNNLSSDDERIDYLVGRGYNEGLARLQVRNFTKLPTLQTNFLVKRVYVNLDNDVEGVRFQVQIGYINRINIEGHAK